MTQEGSGAAPPPARSSCWAASPPRRDERHGPPGDFFQGGGRATPPRARKDAKRAPRGEKAGVQSSSPLSLRPFVVFGACSQAQSPRGPAARGHRSLVPRAGIAAKGAQRRQGGAKGAPRADKGLRASAVSVLGATSGGTPACRAGHGRCPRGRDAPPWQGDSFGPGSACRRHETSLPRPSPETESRGTAASGRAYGGASGRRVATSPTRDTRRPLLRARPATRARAPARLTAPRRGRAPSPPRSRPTCGPARAAPGA